MLARAVVTVAVAALLIAPLADAHGNPAGEWLLDRAAFVPPDAGVSRADQHALAVTLARAKAQGYPLRVAVVAARYDLGELAGLFGQQARYAAHLSEDLQVIYRGRVLVVMPSGFAVARDGKPDPLEQRIVATVRPPRDFQGAAVVAATTRAVRMLAAGRGIVVAPAPVAGSGAAGSTTRDRIVIGGSAAGIALVALWRRRRRASRPGKTL